MMPSALILITRSGPGGTVFRVITTVDDSGKDATLLRRSRLRVIDVDVLKSVLFLRLGDLQRSVE
jgi:hypothetical protein